MTQQALADVLGIRSQTISGWERGVTAPNGNLLGKLASAFGVDPSWVLYGKIDNDSETVVISKSKCNLVHFVSLFDSIQASAGLGIENTEWNDAGEYPLPEEVVINQPDRDDLFCIRAHGNSMEPVFSDGSVLAINPHRKKIIDGRIFVVRTHENLRVKVLKENSKGIVLHSFNHAYEDEFIGWDEIQDGFDVIGEVFWFSSKVNN